MGREWESREGRGEGRSTLCEAVCQWPSSLFSLSSFFFAPLPPSRGVPSSRPWQPSTSRRLQQISRHSCSRSLSERHLHGHESRPPVCPLAVHLYPALLSRKRGASSPYLDGGEGTAHRVPLVTSRRAPLIIARSAAAVCDRDMPSEGSGGVSPSNGTSSCGMVSGGGCMALSDQPHGAFQSASSRPGSLSIRSTPHSPSPPLPRRPGVHQHIRDIRLLRPSRS